MGMKTAGLLRGAILTILLVALLLFVGRWLQSREDIPDAVAPVQPTTAPTATPGPGDGGRDAKVAPTGYAQSCAAANPWGQQVSKPFICIEQPAGGATVRPSFTLRGYAAGAFENTLVLSVVAQQANGARVPATGDIRVPVTYTAPDIGMPGVWEFNVSLGGIAPGGGTVHVEVFAESPKDGSRMMATTLELKLAS